MIDCDISITSKYPMIGGSFFHVYLLFLVFLLIVLFFLFLVKIQKKRKQSAETNKKEDIVIIKRMKIEIDLLYEKDPDILCNLCRRL